MLYYQQVAIRDNVDHNGTPPCIEKILEGHIFLSPIAIIFFLWATDTLISLDSMIRIKKKYWFYLDLVCFA